MNVCCIRAEYLAKHFMFWFSPLFVLDAMAAPQPCPSAPGGYPGPSAPPSYEETTGINVNYPYPYPMPGPGHGPGTKGMNPPPYPTQAVPAANPSK